jgi:hypothetical protein
MRCFRPFTQIKPFEGCLSLVLTSDSQHQGDRVPAYSPSMARTAALCFQGAIFFPDSYGVRFSSVDGGLVSLTFNDVGYAAGEVVFFTNGVLVFGCEFYNV